MSYTLIKKLVPLNRYQLKCPYTMTATRVVIHNTANDATARNEIAYMTRNPYTTSFHYAVDNIEVVQGLLESRNGWHAGDGSTGSGNRKGIGIEICFSKSGGAKFDQAEANAALLTARILKRKGWGLSRITKHQDYSGKYCPHRTLDKGWNRFIGMVDKELVKLNKPAVPVPPPVTAITYRTVKKKVVLIRNANLWDFNFTTWGSAKSIASYPKGHLIEVVAEATNKLKAKYYMTEYSYNGGKIRHTRGFNVADCRDYVEPPVVVEPPKPVPPPVEPPKPPVKPPVEPEVPLPEEGESATSWLAKVLDWIKEVLNKFTFKG